MSALLKQILGTNPSSDGNYFCQAVSLNEMSGLRAMHVRAITRRFERSSGLSPEERLSMKRLVSFSLALGISICMIIGTERRAWGYVDPGSGLIALQTIASVAAAYLYMIRRRIMTFFGKKKENVAPILPVSTKPGESREVA
jgi:hypothetical protein